MMSSEKVRATIKVDLNTQGQLVPFFSVTLQPKSEKSMTLQVPLRDIREFSLGTDEEWFADIAMRQANSTAQQAQAWVIVAPTNGHGVLPVARSGRAKASMADLHGRLLQTFITNRQALLRQFEEQLKTTQQEPTA